jgi:translation initiation factor 1
MNYTFKRTYDLQIRKRKGKVTTVIEGYEGSDADFKMLKEIKLSVGRTFKMIPLSFKEITEIKYGY